MSDPFRNATELPSIAPVAVWHATRAVSVAVFVGLCVALVVRPDGGLFFFWRLLVPLLPLVFLVAPGLWRNVCPLAAANQAPRLWGLTRAKPQAALLRTRGYSLAVVLFLAIVAARRPLLEQDGVALAAVLATVLAVAFANGLVFRGKSGWCSSMCPLLPVQRLYGQAPLIPIANTHCQPCVGCTKNCYDFNPGAAYHADLHEPDDDWSTPRRVFAGAFPGVVIAFFTVPADASTWLSISRVGTGALLGAGAFFAVTALVPLASSTLAATAGATAATAFYWRQGPLMADAWGEVLGTDVAWLEPVVRVLAIAVAVTFLVRSVRIARLYVDRAVATSQPVRLTAGHAAKLRAATIGTGDHEVVFEPGTRVAAPDGMTLLELAERSGVPIEAGCRLGVCGADPIAVLDGTDGLSPPTSDEQRTLRRLGLGDRARLACSARVCGDARVSLEADALRAARAQAVEPAPVDSSVGHVVIIGNGIAGVTAAEVIRRRHPACEVHVVGREPHALYNRMAISRVIYGRTAMRGLQLLDDGWYDENDIACWLNTSARSIDLEGRTVHLATGDVLPYDRLILAMGSRSYVPPIAGLGAPGTFVLREVEDAVALRRFAQDTGARHAVVVGGGLLGIEAAHALRELGLHTTVAERSPRPLVRQLDERASDLLQRYLTNSGIHVATETVLERVEVGAEGRIAAAVTTDGRLLPADVVLLATGVEPNIELARDAGIVVSRGVVVDHGMRTSAPDVFAAGDVAEVDGRVFGLWPVAVDQAEVAAANALGDDVHHELVAPPSLLKGIGLDVLAIGRLEPGAGDRIVLHDDGDQFRYGKVVLDAGDALVGGVLVGMPEHHDLLLAAVRGRTTAERLVGALSVEPRIAVESSHSV